MVIQPQTKIELRKNLVDTFCNLLTDAFKDDLLEDALEDLEKIEDYILGETE